MQTVNVKGVLIDFGDTLAYFDEEGYQKYREELLSILRRHGHEANRKDLTQFLNELYYMSSKGEIQDFERLWQLLLARLRIPEEPLLLEELERFRSCRYCQIFKLHEGAFSVLSYLHRKYRLALVSNCSTGLSEVLRTLGVSDLFDSIVLSYEVGVRKPDRRIYVQALRSLMLEPHECIFVADEISDLEGAREVGLKTLLVRQGSHLTMEAKDPNFKPDLQCNRISEIPQIL